MNHYIPHKILIINEQVQQKESDDAFMHCMKLAFQWANDMGINGKKVSNLYLENPNPNVFDPLRQHKALWCKIECTEEERNQWDSLRKIQLDKMIMDQIKE